jgi:hypothetical protein
MIVSLVAAVSCLAQDARIATMVLLPANDLIATGIRDLKDGRETIASLLVSIGAPKLRSLGVDVPNIPDTSSPSPEHRLYDLLATDNPNSAHSRYNALIKKLVSFERAIPCVRK